MLTMEYVEKKTLCGTRGLQDIYDNTVMMDICKEDHELRSYFLICRKTTEREYNLLQYFFQKGSKASCTWCVFSV
ncbi:hypothetical protein XENTR_v10016906 [Xenopus tropicalis]|nr:hypothetical protein XENTR_v10016906 [Xenopus tropicalis]